jgi:pimeloyl-ACP methyl ester carboxylesterase
MPPEIVYLLGVLAAASAAVLGAGWLAAGRMLRRMKPDPPCPPDTFDLPFEHVIFTARDGVRLGGWLTGERGVRPTVIFCAGLFGSMDGDTHLLPAFFDAGLDVLQFDWRGHGISDGQRITLGVREVEDLLGAIDFLQARGVRLIGLMGFSMGGAVALRAAAQDQRVRCVVVDGPFANPLHALQGGFAERTGRPLKAAARLLAGLISLRLGAPIRSASPLPEAGRISPRPVLFIHGSTDPFVPISDQEALFAACNEPKDLWRVEGAGHRRACEREPEAYLARVIGFFRLYLRG